MQLMAVYWKIKWFAFRQLQKKQKKRLSFCSYGMILEVSQPGFCALLSNAEAMHVPWQPLCKV